MSKSRFIRTLHSIVCLFNNAVRLDWLSGFSTRGDVARSIFLDLHDPALAKDYAVLLLALIRDSTVIVWFRPNFKLLAGFTGLAASLLRASKPCYWWPWHRPPGGARVFTDRSSQAEANHLYLLSPNVRQGSSQPLKKLQVTLHPIFLLDDQIPRVEPSRNLARIFFSGNTDPASYSNHSMASFYKVPTRHQIISHLLDPAWPGESVVVLRSAEDLDRFLNGAYSNRVVIANWQWSPHSTSNLDCRIPSHLWFTILGSVDYFLACPGIRTLDCHNLAEALAMGAMPILPFSDHWHGLFEHGQTALFFRGLDDLPAAIDLALKSPRPDRSLIRQVYLDHFSLQAIANTLLDPGLSPCRAVSFYQEVYVPYAS
jgi:hypothetical protein